MNARPLSPPYVLLGDAAFQLTSFLVKPFAGGTAKQIEFDNAFSAMRGSVEMAFGHWKGNFRVIDRGTRRDGQSSEPLVRGTLHLHNFIIKQRTTVVGTPFDDVPVQDQEAGAVREALQHEDEDEREEMAGRAARMRVFNAFFRRHE